MAAVDTLKQKARDRLFEKLARGQLQPGARISEQRLAREMGTSRGPVREAVNQLTSQGILDHIPGFGSFVKVPTPREMEDLYEFREALECHAAFLAAGRVNSIQLMVLRKTLSETRGVLAEMYGSGKRDLDDATAAAWASIDTCFHGTIFEAAGSTWLQRHGTDCQFLRRIWCQRLDPALFDIRTAMLRSYRDHTRIVRALAHGDAEQARRFMLAHVSAVKQRFVTQIIQQKPVAGPSPMGWPIPAPSPRHAKRGRPRSRA